MANRVSASIEIGGEIAAGEYEVLIEIAASYGLSSEWGGEPFDGERVDPGGSLELYACEVIGGDFDELQSFCVTHGLPFMQWCDGYPGGWNAERLVFTGVGEPVSYAAMEDFVVIGRKTAETLGSYDAIIANFAEADFAIPALIVVPADARCTGSA